MVGGRGGGIRVSGRTKLRIQPVWQQVRPMYHASLQHRSRSKLLCLVSEVCNGNTRAQLSRSHMRVFNYSLAVILSARYRGSHIIPGSTETKPVIKQHMSGRYSYVYDNHLYCNVEKVLCTIQARILHLLKQETLEVDASKCPMRWSFHAQPILIIHESKKKKIMKSSGARMS